MFRNQKINITYKRVNGDMV
ncbi:hypothetical protein [Romboutsia lituseburensis]|nr:hypothetical protein [Romboutsia lituseburensis]